MHCCVSVLPLSPADSLLSSHIFTKRGPAFIFILRLSLPSKRLDKGILTGCQHLTRILAAKLFPVPPAPSPASLTARTFFLVLSSDPMSRSGSRWVWLCLVGPLSESVPLHVSEGHRLHPSLLFSGPSIPGLLSFRGLKRLPFCSMMFLFH